PLAFDDDVPAEIAVTVGGQAANVAAWTVALGGSATVFGPRGSGAGQVATTALQERGIAVVGPDVVHGGIVISLLGPGSRSLISDQGDTGYLDQITPGPWLEDADWLYVSGYALLRTPR